MVWMSFLTASMAIKDNTHVRISVFDKFFGEKALKIRDIIFSICNIAFSLILFWEGSKLVIQTSRTKLPGSDSSGILYASICVGGLLMAIMLVYRMGGESMSTETVGTIILLASFFIMIFAGNHIIFSIGISTLLTLLYLKVPLMTVAQQSVKGLNSFSLMAVPFFILMGDIMSAGGITDRLVNLANALVGGCGAVWQW